MYAVIKGELINGSGVRFAPRPHPWVARITGVGEQYSLARQFMDCVYDYTYARRSGGRGIHAYYFLPPGLYDCFIVTSWRHHDRFFIRVRDDGQYYIISRDEVDLCLRNGI